MEEYYHYFHVDLHALYLCSIFLSSVENYLYCFVDDEIAGVESIVDEMKMNSIAIVVVDVDGTTKKRFPVKQRIQLVVVESRLW